MHWLSQLAMTPFRVMPPVVRRRLVQLISRASAAGQAAPALRELLTMDADISGQIDLVALSYGDGVHVKHRIMRYHDFFVERVRAAERVLDIGCGYGAVANSIASRSGAHVVGLDLSAANVQKARQLFQQANLTFVEGEAPGTLPAGKFDVIVMSNVLEHIDRRVEFLREVQGKIKPSRWLLRVPMFDRDWRPSLRQELGLYAYGDPTHFTEYTLASFEREMAEAGFTIRHLQVNWGEIWAEVSATAHG
ncbi:MAG TPA: class I SAM-dependent methyltransferase [Vicinamibacterales bacterium]|nr:class I SAM-dependent methyltransferase [Vicinamibacterales bacterium]